jgi:ADP-heptose:LPS heptosyltransferase
MRVLIIFPGALGDVICLAPAIRAIARRHSKCSIELMARAELAHFAVGRIGIAAGHSIDRREVSALFGDQPSPAALEFFGQFGAIYSFFAADDPNFRGSLRAATRGAVSFHRFRPDGEGHISSLYLESIEASREPLDSHIDLSSADISGAERVINLVHTHRGKVLLFFPGSGSATKNWPTTRFLELARAVSSVANPVAVLGPAESAMGAHLRKTGIAILQDLDLAIVAALAHLAAGFVGNDSGVSHLAAAAGCPGVVLFGPTDPARWHPLGDITVVRREPLESLQVAEVLNIIRARLVTA